MAAFRNLMQSEFIPYATAAAAAIIVVGLQSTRQNRHMLVRAQSEPPKHNIDEAPPHKQRLPPASDRKAPKPASYGPLDVMVSERSRLMRRSSTAGTARTARSASEAAAALRSAAGPEVAMAADSIASAACTLALTAEQALKAEDKALTARRSRKSCATEAEQADRRMDFMIIDALSAEV